MIPFSKHPTAAQSKIIMLNGSRRSFWKIASVTPVYKKGLKEDPSNYRPISLTSMSGKVMEHIVVSSLMKFLDRVNFFDKNQHGFRKSRSCETQHYSLS